MQTKKELAKTLRGMAAALDAMYDEELTARRLGRASMQSLKHMADFAHEAFLNVALEAQEDAE